ncbi:MAG: DUF3786 domain-containing protein [Thermodesulfobacteriota bacterium]
MRSPIFEITYANYLRELSGVDLRSLESGLGRHHDGKSHTVSFFNKTCRITREGITDLQGELLPFDIRIVVLKYLLMCPGSVSIPHDWAAFRVIRGSAPLLGYFSHNVEEVLVNRFSGRTQALSEAAGKLGGYAPESEFPYDLSRCFNALPRVRLLMLFNDADDQFPAHCSVLLDTHSEAHLDPECLAIVAVRLARSLCESDEEGAPLWKERS